LVLSEHLIGATPPLRLNSSDLVIAPSLLSSSSGRLFSLLSGTFVVTPPSQLLHSTTTNLDITFLLTSKHKPPRGVNVTAQYNFPTPGKVNITSAAVFVPGGSLPRTIVIKTSKDIPTFAGTLSFVIGGPDAASYNAIPSSSVGLVGLSPFFSVQIVYVFPVTPSVFLVQTLMNVPLKHMHVLLILIASIWRVATLVATVLVCSSLFVINSPGFIGFFFSQRG
jgi:hypothetical protein